MIFITEIHITIWFNAIHRHGENYFRTFYMYMRQCSYCSWHWAIEKPYGDDAFKHLNTKQHSSCYSCHFHNHRSLNHIYAYRLVCVTFVVKLNILWYNEEGSMLPLKEKRFSIEHRWDIVVHLSIKLSIPVRERSISIVVS